MLALKKKLTLHPRKQPKQTLADSCNGPTATGGSRNTKLPASRSRVATRHLCSAKEKKNVVGTTYS